MSDKPDSKEKTIIAAAKLLRRHGYNGTALSDILAAAGSPRGSLYFHFPNGKEEIAVAALTHAADSVRQAIAGAAKTSKSADEFLIRIAHGDRDIRGIGSIDGSSRCCVSELGARDRGRSAVVSLQRRARQAAGDCGAESVRGSTPPRAHLPPPGALAARRGADSSVSPGLCQDLVAVEVASTFASFEVFVTHDLFAVFDAGTER